MRIIVTAVFLTMCSSAAFSEPKSGIFKSNFDPSVRIQDNLYLAVNGGWQKNVEIPADRTRWGTFPELRDLSEKRVKEIVESAGDTATTDPTARRITDFYRSFMDIEAVEKAGLSPLRPLLKEVMALTDQSSIAKEFGRLQRLGVSLPFSVGVSIDARNSSNYILNISQSGLGLPDRDYYLQSDERMGNARVAYEEYLATLLKLHGDSAAVAKQRVAGIIALESEMAKIQLSRVDRRDPIKSYNKLDLNGLDAAAPGFDWAAFLDATGRKIDTVNLSQPTYAKSAAQLIRNTEIAVWHDYLTVRLLDRFAPVLPQAFVDAHFLFHEKALAGAKELRPRWKRGVALLEGNIGEDIGKQYVARHFPSIAKERMDILVSNLFKAYAQSIDALLWMSPTTKAQAKDKLSKYSVKIGYPEKWRDYSQLDIKSDDLYGNVYRGAEFAYKNEMDRLGKNIDRTEWRMTPQTVNAYYNASTNEIVFPAGILQAPFFDALADDAVNYGAIGAVIGHEISHGFDDRGSQFDGDGNLRSWWLDLDKKAFTGLTSKLVEQFDAYSPIEGRYINGKLTLGENIADLSGLQVAHKGYRLSLSGQQAPVIDGFTGDQRFFIGFAQVWRGKAREEYMLQGLVSDPHSPSEFRAIGAVMNSDAFHEAFDVKPSDKMFKPKSDRIGIW